MKKALINLSVSTVLAFGATASAFAQVIQSGAGSTGGQSLLNLLALAQTIVVRLVPFLIGLAVVVFFYNLVMFIVKGSSDPAKHGEYARGMGFSILALFVMVSIWGLVGFFGSFFGIGQGGSVPVPGIPTP